MQTVRRRDAIKKPTEHQFVPGIGYIKHPGEPEVDPSVVGTKNCEAPAPADGSKHVFRHAGGAEHVLVWHAAHKAWGPDKIGDGNRLAWTPAYLSRHGWEYVKAYVAPPPEESNAAPPKGKRVKS